MRDIGAGRTADFEEAGPVQEQSLPDGATLARIHLEARRLQGQALRRLIGRAFGRVRRPHRDDAVEEALDRGHGREVGVLHRIGESAARALSRRAVAGNMSDHLLGDVGLTRRDIDGFRASGPRTHHPDIGSTAA